ncbi:MAG: hypothetical protein AABX08_00265 [Nanoarchaeota archaeon]
MIQSKIKKRKKKNQRNLSEKAVIIFMILIMVFSSVVLIYMIKSFFFKMNNNQNSIIFSNPMGSKLSRMSLTSFDIQLAKKFMDKNNDGLCDSCGMDVNLCIDSGQIECNMDSKSTIGVLGSQHVHADWKLYLNGKLVEESLLESLAMDMSKIGNRITSSFIHLDKGAPAPEKTGDIIHMHATGVPLWMFFDSIELRLPEGMKAYINGKEVSDYKNYVFNDLDKILITDGEGDLSEELDSVTDFAKNH